MNNYHIFKYYINAAHSADNQMEHAHTHTFTIAFWIEQPAGGENLPFSQVDSMIEAFLQTYRGKYLNTEPDFIARNPTLENIGEAVYDKMEQKMKRNGLKLLQVEICENPLRVYSVSNQILLPCAYANQLDKNWEKIIAMKQANMARSETERSLS